MDDDRDEVGLLQALAVRSKVESPNAHFGDHIRHRGVRPLPVLLETTPAALVMEVVLIPERGLFGGLNGSIAWAMFWML